MIKVLDSYIADKIAAGEVIEKPLSIVKELVENSIDAGATSIIVEIRKGGKSYIRVTDNGSGIATDEIETAFLRHATGKISSMDDLGHIATLGFRGEALASIAAISRVTVVSRTSDASQGTRLIMHGAKKISIESIGSNQGTTMIIEDVFYNTPARRKFMGSDGREATSIIDLIEKMAIYYSSIRFTLINNGDTVLSTSGNGNYSQTIHAVYPTREFSNLIEIKSDGVHGFISDPQTTKNNRRGQIFFVNGRIVGSKVIEKGIERGYGSRIFSGYPVAVLFITVPPETIDVNIHPGKREIKFLDETEIISKISDAISQVMNTRESVASVTYDFDKSDVACNLPIRETVTLHEYDTSSQSDFQVTRPIVNNPSSKKETNLEKSEQVGIRDFLSSVHTSDTSTEPADVIIKKADTRPFEFSELRYAGYIFSSYIIMETKDAIYMLDQHAAHERIFYEKLVGQYNSEEQLPQPILTPYVIDVSSAVYNMDRDWMETIKRIGYDIDDFGENTFVIRGIPPYMSTEEADSFARSFLDNIGDMSGNTSVIDKLIMKSCKSAVKANNRLSEMEITDLLSTLSECINPFCCPHGRPTFIRMTKYEIERFFRRK